MTDEPDHPTPDPTPDPAGAPTTGRPTTGATPGTASAPDAVNGFGTAALVLGIVAVVAAVNGWWLFLLPVAIATAVLAIVFGVTGRRRADDGRATNRGQATAGLTLGIVASALVVAGGVAFAVWGDGWDRDKDDGVEECIDDADDVDELRTCIDEFPELLEELTS
jgi:hypothetical protein